MLARCVAMVNAMINGFIRHCEDEVDAANHTIATILPERDTTSRHCYSGERQLRTPAPGMTIEMGANPGLGSAVNVKAGHASHFENSRYVSIV